MELANTTKSVLKYFYTIDFKPMVPTISVLLKCNIRYIISTTSTIISNKYMYGSTYIYIRTLMESQDWTLS